MRAGVRRTAVAGVGWLAAAAAATLIGIGGIRLIGDSLTSTPGGVLDEQDVAKALAATPAPTTVKPNASTSTSTSATPTTAGSEKAFSSAGGTVLAGCRGNQAYLVSWSPSPGYRVTQQETESEHVDVRFEGAGGRDDIRVSCSGGHPVQQQRGGHGN